MYQMFYCCPELTTIYVSDKWSNESVTASTRMFRDCNKLVVGNGTLGNSGKVTADYAHIDAEGNPGYFTDIKDKPVSGVETL